MTKLVNLEIITDEFNQRQAQLFMLKLRSEVLSRYGMLERRAFERYPVSSEELSKSITYRKYGSSYSVGIHEDSPAFNTVMDYEFGYKNGNRVVRPVLEQFARR